MPSRTRKLAWLLLLSPLTLCFAASSDSAFRTPPAPLTPRINGPRIYGARPNHEFLYRIPCTGQRPIRFSVKGLPSSLTLDPQSGIITGKAPSRPGTYQLAFTAANSQGSVTRNFRLVIGERLALTPPMGWNDWYTHYHRVSDQLMRQAADTLINSGMADYGYQYVNIDDCWTVRPDASDPEIGGPARNADGSLRTNRRFPDMKGLADYIHSKGLKAGLYSSPGPRTCAGYEGSYQHEKADAEQFAQWGFDFLKYDWCSYSRVAQGKTLEEYKKPYQLMGNIVAALDRDVIFNLCQYGMGDVWKWGDEVGGHAWRTTGDLGLEKGNKLPGFYYIGFKNAEHPADAGPGHWNDPDYILIGSVGNAFNTHELARKTTLTADEQYSYMSMWALMASPLFFGGDMNHLDPFTVNVLCNSEVIDVNQDPLGVQARIVTKTETLLVLAKPLEDHSLAVGLFNLEPRPATIQIPWKQLGVTAVQSLRDVWRQRDIPAAAGQLEANVPAHGVALFRITTR